MKIRGIFSVLVVMMMCAGVLFAGDQKNTGVAGQADRPTLIGAVDRQVVLPPVDADVLYDQSADAGANSISSQNFEVDFDAFDDEAGDDFVIPNGETWNISQVTALGAYYNGFGPMASANVWFYTDAAGFPGTIIDSRLGVVPTSDVAGTIVLDFADVTLTGGTYWMVVQANMDFALGGQWGWTVNTVLHNSGSVWRNPGGGFAVCPTWGRTTTCIGIVEPDYSFIIGGTIGGGGIPCEAFTSFIARCISGGTIQARVNLMNSTQYAGEVVTFLVDEDAYNATIVTNGIHSRAQIQVAGVGIGPHTVDLFDPDCFSPVNVNCRAAKSTADDEWAADDARWAEAGVEVNTAPSATALKGNYPNPFNPSTTIRYALAADTYVSVKVYNMLGQEVATLVDGFQKAGEQSVVWNGTNKAGSTVASGLYIYKLQAGSVVLSEKMLFAK